MFDTSPINAILLLLIGLYSDESTLQNCPRPSGGGFIQSQYSFRIAGFYVRKDMTQPKPLPELSEKDVCRFWKTVNIPDDADACWEWTGCNDGKYGIFGIRKRYLKAHRVAWKIATGRSPKKLVCHHCDNGLCIRFEHLFDGSAADNILDCKNKGRTSKGLKHSIAVTPSKPRGERHYLHKLTVDKVRRIRELRQSGVGPSEIGRMFGVCGECVNAVFKRITWKHVV